MKNCLLIASFCLFVFGCAKKTRISENSKISNQIKEISDSTDKKKLLTQDKSVITTSIDLDTSIRLTGSPLTGILNSDGLIKHFENNDLSIDFKRDQSGLNIAFKATPKIKTINALYHKRIITRNNIVKSENLQSKIEKKLQLEQDSTYNHLIDHRDPTSSISNIRSIIIWSTIFLALIMASYYVIKKKLI